MSFLKPKCFFEKNNFLKSSFDVLDGLYRPDRPRVVGAILNKSFKKDSCSKKSHVAGISAGEVVNK